MHLHMQTVTKELAGLLIGSWGLEVSGDARSGLPLACRPRGNSAAMLAAAAAHACMYAVFVSARG